MKYRLHDYVVTHDGNFSLNGKQVEKVYLCLSEENGKLLYKIFINFLFVFDNCLLYFIILKIINNGMFHIYFLFLLILGYLFGNYLLKNKN